LRSIQAQIITYQCRNTAAAAVLRYHPHCLADREGFDHMIDIAGLCFTEKLKCVDFFHKFRISIGEAWVQSVTLVNIDNLDSDNRSRSQVSPKQ
jgi:hypothetical protein